MMRSMYLKTVYEKRWFVIGWAAGFFALAAIMVSFFPAMRPEGGFDALLANMPAAFQGLIGNLSDLSQFDTYLASQLFDIRIPLIAGIMAIILGLSVSTAEEESGELRTALAMPISRTKVLIEKWLAMETILVLTSIGLLLGVLLIAPFVEDATIDLILLLKLIAMTLVLMTTFGTITFGSGMAFGKKGIANAIGIFVIMGSFILTTFGQAVDWLEPVEILSVLYYFPAVDIVKTGIEFRDVAVLSGITLTLLVAAWLRFRSRDIA